MPGGRPVTTPMDVSVPSPSTMYSATVPLPVSAYSSRVPFGDVRSIGPVPVVAAIAWSSVGCPPSIVNELIVLLAVFET
jgi:hypothetical protein